VFAECCVFDKQSQPPGHCGCQQLRMCILHRQQRTFSRSYGTILPSSFTRVLSSALVFSTRPPVSVWGTINGNLKLRGFSRKRGISDFPSVDGSSRVSEYSTADLPAVHPYRLSPGLPTPGSPSLLRPPIAVTVSAGILTRFPSTTPFGLALGVDSPCPD
jgi:hypothetical protein